MKKIIFSENAAKPIGPYSQAVAGDGKLLFISDTIPLLKDGSVAPNNIEAQTRQVLENIKAVLTEAGLTFQHIVKTTVFLQDLNDFGKMNEVYAEYFTEGFPARTAIQVSRIPKDVLIGMEAVAVFEL